MVVHGGGGSGRCSQRAMGRGEEEQGRGQQGKHGVASLDVVVEDRLTLLLQKSGI